MWVMSRCVSTERGVTYAIITGTLMMLRWSVDNWDIPQPVSYNNYYPECVGGGL